MLYNCVINWNNLKKFMSRILPCLFSNGDQYSTLSRVTSRVNEHGFLAIIFTLFYIVPDIEKLALNRYHINCITPDAYFCHQYFVSYVQMTNIKRRARLVKLLCTGGVHGSWHMTGGPEMLTLLNSKACISFVFWVACFNIYMGFDFCCLTRILFFSLSITFWISWLEVYTVRGRI